MSTIRSSIQLQDRMTPALRSITTALNVTINSFEALQRASHNSVDTASITAARRELASAEVAINQVEQEIREANNAQQQFNGSVRSGGSGMDRLVGKVRNLASAYLGIRAAQAGMNATDSYINNQARLGLIVDVDATAVDAAQQKIRATADLQNEIYAAAQRSRGEYGAMVNDVAKLGLLAGDSFSNTDEIIAFTETMQKAFKVSGASTQEATNAMYQLNQAMASGRLQGDEYRSIIENAPMLANALADYCGVARGELKDLSSDGALTADVIKGAVFNMAEDLETQFNQMPMTFSDVWTQIKNTATMQARGVMQNVNNALNSSDGQAIIQGITSVTGALISALGVVLTLVMNVSGFVSDNWSIIQPIVMGIVVALGLYTGAIVANNIANGIHKTLEIGATIAAYAHAAATRTQVAATTAQTAAQYGLNTALLASPITWIIIAIVAVVAALAIWIKRVGGLKVAWAMVSAYLLLTWDLLKIGFMKCVYGIANFLDALVLAWNSASTAVQNWCGDMKVGVLQILQDMTNGGIDIINSFIEQLNKLPGVSIRAIEHVTFAAGAVAANEAEKQARNEVLQYQRDNFEIEQQKRQDIVSKMEQQAQDLFNTRMQKAWDLQAEARANQNKDNDYDLYSSIGEGVGSIADNTGRTADALDATEEDLKYLRDLAEQEVIDRTVFRDIKIDLGGITNNVNSNMDLDGIVDYIGTALEDAILTSAEGVH